MTGVLVVGAGPTGMMLAAELQLAGVDVLVVERRPTSELESSRARGLGARTLEIFDMRGILDRFLDASTIMQNQTYASIRLDMSDLPSRRPYGLALLQRETERLMADWVDELSVPFLRGESMAGFTQGDAGVTVTLESGGELRADYLVGCDGSRSLVRKGAGIDFPGLEPITSWMIAEFELTSEPPVGVRPEGGGIGPVNWKVGGNPYSAAIKEPSTAHTGEPTLADLRSLLTAVYGSDFGVHSPTWISRFNDAHRQASAYRAGRVFIAGDAAHIHPPQGGQGLNTGLQDAVNLGWKLAAVLLHGAPSSLLDTYHAERHPVGARVQHNTKAQIALSTYDERHIALREEITAILALDEPRIRKVAEMSALDTFYDLGAGHPLVGRRVPDVDLPSGPLYALLHDARPALLTTVPADLGGWSDRVQMISTSYDGPWKLPVLGDVGAGEAVLIRPDGHVAWTGHPADPSLARALERWFGPPA